MDDMGFQIPSHTYFSSVNPLVLLTNSLRYLYLFFNLDQSGQVFTMWGIRGLLVVAIAIAYIIVPPFLEKHAVNKSSGVIYLLLIFASLLPVLPLVNMQHKLYLYIPSIFICLGLGNSLVRRFEDILTDKIKVVIVAVVLLIVLSLCISTNSVYKSEIGWWKDVGEENRVVFLAMQKIKIASDIDTIEIINIDKPTTIFQFGPGDVLRSVWGRPNLNITLHDANTEENTESRRAHTLTFDYALLKQGIALPKQ